MRLAHPRRLVLVVLAVLAAPLAAYGQDAQASAPFDVSVTIYRNPYRGEGGFDLNNLQGFALVTESRRVVLQPGEHRLRFEGVADGIEPASAILTGLPSGVIEKNRDAALLSPSALIASAAAQQGRVILARTNPRTGATLRAEGKIRSGADGGVVVETSDGLEALRCSGLAETVTFESATTGLSALPTLSVLTRVTAPVEAVVQLSYLSRGFDWSADYVANIETGGEKLNLGAWITLANGNGTGFSNARVQIVAGRLNRSSRRVEPIEMGQPILARCWPQGSTSDSPEPIRLEQALPLGFIRYFDSPMPPPMPAPAVAKAMASGARRVEQEELGDLKLYRVPDRTTVASRQSKQVRLLDRDGVPFAKVYEAELFAAETTEFQPIPIVLRTRNDKQNHLGLPLPSGRVSVFETIGAGASAQRLLAAKTDLRDIAVNEETELRLNGAPDVQVRQFEERRSIAAVAGDRRGAPRATSSANRVEISNARPNAIHVEVRLSLNAGQKILKADRPFGQKNGRPILRVTVPANTTLQIRYQTASQ